LDNYNTMLYSKFRLARMIVSVFIVMIISLPGARAQYFRTGEVKCVSNDARLVTVASTYTAKSLADAQVFAERNALENLLFKGIAGCYDKPIVAKEAESMQAHAAFYDWLITKREYERFITERTVVTNSKKKKIYNITETITFDVQALRKEMEQQGVTKKFGF
jgi:hypothetical protein